MTIEQIKSKIVELDALELEIDDYLIVAVEYVIILNF